MEGKIRQIKVELGWSRATDFDCRINNGPTTSSLLDNCFTRRMWTVTMISIPLNITQTSCPKQTSQAPCWIYTRIYSATWKGRNQHWEYESSRKVFRSTVPDADATTEVSVYPSSSSSKQCPAAVIANRLGAVQSQSRKEWTRHYWLSSDNADIFSLLLLKMSYRIDHHYGSWRIVEYDTIASGQLAGRATWIDRNPPLHLNGQCSNAWYHIPLYERDLSP